MSDTTSEQPQQEGAQVDSTAKQHTNKLENPESIPVAGGKTIGEDHQGESKMLADNARSESTAASGDADDLQKKLEGKKVEDRTAGGEGEKQGVVEKAKEKLGLGKKD